MFSDKTGTLTENTMEFIECSIDGFKYDADPAKNADVPKYNRAEKVKLLLD